MSNKNATAANPIASVPSFPQFETLQLEHKEIVERLEGNYIKYSDYSFFSMLTYDVNSCVQISLLNENLVVKFFDYLTLRPFYSFIGSHSADSTIHTLLLKTKEENTDPVLKLIPETVVENLNKTVNKYYEICPDEDNFDYVCSTKQLSELSGKHYRSQKNTVNKFLKEYPDIKVEVIDNLLDRRSEMLDVFNKWEKEKNKNSNDITDANTELTAIERAVEFSSNFQLHTIALVRQNLMIGFMIADINNGYPMGSFGKYDLNYKGAFSFLLHTLAKELYNMGYDKINIEQDLGIPGLRAAKRLWKPTEYLKKYKIVSK